MAIEKIMKIIVQKPKGVERRNKKRLFEQQKDVRKR
jgi:hypothetical protein